jgi:hypothetical protein
VLDSTFLLLFCINIIFDLTNDHDFFDRGLVITTKDVIDCEIVSRTKGAYSRSFYRYSLSA